MAATVLVVLFAGELNRTGRIYLLGIAGLMATLIGLSRVAPSVHYVSDVLAGYCVGVACVSLVTNSLWGRR